MVWPISLFCQRWGAFVSFCLLIAKSDFDLTSSEPSEFSRSIALKRRRLSLVHTDLNTSDWEEAAQLA